MTSLIMGNWCLIISLISTLMVSSYTFYMFLSVKQKPKMVYAVLGFELGILGIAIGRNLMIQYFMY